MTEALVRKLLDGHRQVLIDATAANLASIRSGIEPAAVTYFEPRMLGPQGHFPLLTDAYGRLCKNCGVVMNVFHHQDWHSARPRGWHGVFPVVDHLVGADAPVDKVVLDVFSEMVETIVRPCADQSGARIALFPTTRFLTLPGIAAAIASSRGLLGGVIGVMETTPVPDCNDEELVQTAFRSSAQTLAASGKQVLLVAESAAIANWLVAQGFDRQSVLICPYPAAARFHTPASPPPSQSRPRLGAFGATRPVHQPHRLARYLLEADLSDADWRVRIDLAHAAQPLALAPDELERKLKLSGVTLLPNHLQQPDYDAALANLDVMLLPYGDRYNTIGSGIFLECVCAGVIPLVPAGSTMRALYETLGGEAPAINTGTPEDIARVVNTCLTGLTPLRANARQVRQAWLTHPQGPAVWRRAVTALLERAAGG